MWQRHIEKICILDKMRVHTHMCMIYNTFINHYQLSHKIQSFLLFLGHFQSFLIFFNFYHFFSFIPTPLKKNSQLCLILFNRFQFLLVIQKNLIFYRWIISTLTTDSPRPNHRSKNNLKRGRHNFIIITIYNLQLMACLVLFNQSGNVIKMAMIIPFPCLVTIKGCDQDCIVITFISIYAITITWFFLNYCNYIHLNQSLPNYKLLYLGTFSLFSPSSLLYFRSLITLASFFLKIWSPLTPLSPLPY